MRPPPEHVPALLELATRRPELQAAVAAAAGPLGSWLSERELRWAFARTEDDPRWCGPTARARSGGCCSPACAAPTRTPRASSSRARSPTSPGRTAWRSSRSSRRNLSDADEPFLERAHQDGRQPVREAAANAARAAARARAYAQRAADEAKKPPARREAACCIATLPEARGRRSERLTRPARRRAAEHLGPRAASGCPSPTISGRAVHLGWAAAAYRAAQRRLGARAVARSSTTRACSPSCRAREAEAPRAAAPMSRSPRRSELPGPWGPLLSRKIIELVPTSSSDRGVRVVDFAGYRLDPSLASRGRGAARPRRPRRPRRSATRWRPGLPCCAELA